jgi:hypothetical protein
MARCASRRLQFLSPARLGTLASRMPSRSKDELRSALHYSYLLQEHLAVYIHTAAPSHHRRCQERKTLNEHSEGANSSAGIAVAYQQMGDCRGAGARAAGQTDTAAPDDFCHIACSSNIDELAKRRQEQK